MMQIVKLEGPDKLPELTHNLLKLVTALYDFETRELS